MTATLRAAPKVNYLNNRDILKEIHLSKNSYCSFRDPAIDHQFDIILPSVSKINQKTIAEAKRARADRLAKQAWEASQLAGIKTKLDDHAIDYRKIKKHELVFRDRKSTRLNSSHT